MTTSRKPPAPNKNEGLNLLRDALLAGLVLFAIVVLVIYLPQILVSAKSQSVQDRVHTFLYAQQPQQLGDFVKYAREQMSDVPPAQIAAALEAEGEFQASKGHPTAVGVLSIMAISYYDAYGISYTPETWQKRQNRAFDMSRTSNVQLTDLWPAKQK